MPKTTTEDQEELVAIEYFLNKHKDRISIVSQGCIHKLVAAEHDEEGHGVVLRCVFTNTNELPHKAAKG